MNCTDPPEPPVTVAVNVTSSPKSDGFFELTTDVLVAAFTLKDELSPALTLSPDVRVAVSTTFDSALL